MVEATPGVPYAGDVAALLSVEASMVARRARIAAALYAPPLVGAIGVHCWWWRAWLAGMGRRAAAGKAKE
jgi:hypothetical protein